MHTWRDSKRAAGTEEEGTCAARNDMPEWLRLTVFDALRMGYL